MSAVIRRGQLASAGAKEGKAPLPQVLGTHCRQELRRMLAGLSLKLTSLPGTWS